MNFIIKILKEERFCQNSLDVIIEQDVVNHPKLNLNFVVPTVPTAATQI